MPTYTFINKTTGEVVEKFCSLAEREEFLKDTEWFQSLAAPPQGDPIKLGITRTPDSFNDLLKNISKRNDNRRNKSEIRHR